LKNRELIKELLEYDMDSDVTFVIGEEELDDFSIQEKNHMFSTPDLQLVIETNGQELIDKGALEDLKTDVESIGDFKDKITDLEQQVYTLESQME
jgi:ABC-type phosphate transport system auxiliary subunit